MDQKPIDAAKKLLQYVQEHPKSVDTLKETQPDKPIDIAKRLIKHLKENPTQFEELKKTMLAAPTTAPEPIPKPIDLAKDLLKALRENPNAIEELAKAKGKQLDGDEQEVKEGEDPQQIQKELDKIKEGDKSIIRDSMVQDVSGMVTGDGKNTGPGKHSRPKKQDTVTNKIVEKEKSVKGVTTKKGELPAGKKMSGMEQKQMIKDELRADFKPRFCKAAAPASATLQLPKPPKPKPPPKPQMQLKAELSSPERTKMIKDELRADFKPRFCKAATSPYRYEDSSPVRGVHEPPEPGTGVSEAGRYARGIRQVASKETPEGKKFWQQHQADRAKQEHKRVVRELRRMPVANLPKSELAGASGGNMAPGGLAADANPTAMKAQKDPSFKPVPATKIIKPSDVVEGGADAMGVPKAKMGIPQKPKAQS